MANQFQTVISSCEWFDRDGKKPFVKEDLAIIAMC